MQQDIAKILHDVKLPEHRDFRASGEAPKAQGIPLTSALDALDRPIESAPAPEAPAAPAAQAPSEPQSPVAPLHTLKQDLQHIVQDQHISYVHAVALETDKHPDLVREQMIEAPRRSYATGIIVTVCILLFVGVAALGGVFLAQAVNKAPIPQQTDTSLVFAEQSVALPFVPGSGTNLKGTLAQVRAASHASLGSITQITPAVASSSNATTGIPATLSQFLTAMGAHPPDELLRALSDQFFLGLHTVDSNAPFFVIPVTDYDHAFSGMLAWEPNMNADLAPFFTPVPQFVTGSDGLPAARTFSDEVMRNYDVRALKDDSGQIVLYYSFPTRDILIIAESPYTFPEVLTRLQAQRRL